MMNGWKKFVLLLYSLTMFFFCTTLYPTPPILTK